MKTCLLCSKEFQSIRSTAIFCSGACRLKYKRAKNSVSKTLELVTLRVDNETLSPEKPAKDVTLRLGVTETDSIHCSDCKFKMQFSNGIPWIPNWFKYHLKGKVKSRDDAYMQIRAEIEANYKKINTFGLN